MYYINILLLTIMLFTFTLIYLSILGSLIDNKYQRSFFPLLIKKGLSKLKHYREQLQNLCAYLINCCNFFL